MLQKILVYYNWFYWRELFLETSRNVCPIIDGRNFYAYHGTTWQQIWFTIHLTHRFWNQENFQFEGICISSHFKPWEFIMTIFCSDLRNSRLHKIRPRRIPRRLENKQTKCWDLWAGGVNILEKEKLQFLLFNSFNSWENQTDTCKAYENNLKQCFSAFMLLLPSQEPF